MSVTLQRNSRQKEFLEVHIAVGQDGRHIAYSVDLESSVNTSRLHDLLTLILGNHVYKAIAHCSPHLSQAWCLITRPLRTSCVSHDLVYLFPKSWIATTKLPRSQDRAFGTISGHGQMQMSVFDIGCNWLKASRLCMLAINNVQSPSTAGE